VKIVLDKLTKSYQDASKTLTIIDCLTYEFPEGEKIAIVGKSGIGKSTLLHILGGLDKPTSGSVYFNDLDISAMKSDELSRFRGAHAGFIFQFHHLLPEFDALENVSMPLIIGGQGETSAREKAVDVLVQVGLEKRMNHRPSALSGGEQQRVAIARALVTEPDVLLADEPTGNLDSETAKEIQNLLFEVNEKLGNTLIVATHNAELAESMDLKLEMQVGGLLRKYQ